MKEIRCEEAKKVKKKRRTGSLLVGFFSQILTWVDSRRY